MNRRTMMLNLLLQNKTVWLKLPEHNYADLLIDSINEDGTVNLDKYKDGHFEDYAPERVFWALGIWHKPITEVYEFIDNEFGL